MNQLFIVDFYIKTDKYKNNTHSCQQTVFANSYDDAAQLVKNTFSQYCGFKLSSIHPIGNPELNSRPAFPHEKEIFN